jgi:hypothetical protein
MPPVRFVCLPAACNDHRPYLLLLLSIFLSFFLSFFLQGHPSYPVALGFFGAFARTVLLTELSTDDSS